ncbi:MAG: hypothetical protein IIB44_05270 [Candidatus Marinimicrobia bacterium]|nr:hypothetical protein [Candidatus Neomarinimicrobiota bacterium]
MFSLGLLFNKIRETNKEKKKLNELEVYYLDLVSSLIDPVDKQSKNLRSLADSIKDKKARNFELTESSEIFFDVFDQIPHQDIYKILVLNKKSASDERYTHYKNILNSIEFLKLRRELSRFNFTKFMDDLRRYESDWNTNANLIIRSFDKYVSFNKSQGIEPSQDPFLKEFDILIHNARQLDDFQNMYVCKEYLLNPLKKYCQDNFDDPRAFELIQFIVSANYAFNDLVNLKEFYSEAFMSESEKLKDFKNKLEQAVEFFGNAILVSPPP